MYTRVPAEKKPDPSFGTRNKNSITSQRTVKKPKVRSTDYRILLQLVLSNPDSITPQEFLFLQSAIGYQEAMNVLEEGKRSKLLQKMGVTATATRIQPKETNRQEGENTPSGDGLPENLKNGLEFLSGVSLSDVKLHKNSEKPQSVGALAYTQGNDIHIAPGQEKYLPHEGWHAVQQKQGRVEATVQMKSGTLLNDDTGLEKEADVMGSRAEREASESRIIQSRQTGELNSSEIKGNVIQRVTQQEGMELALKNTKKPDIAENDEIIPAAYGETSQNVKKIQQILINMNYWTGKSGDKATGYFGEVTKESLISFQTGYMKLGKKELYDKNGIYVGCGPSTAKSLNNVYKLLNNQFVPYDAKKDIMGQGKREENNAAYNWDIKAGVFNGYVKEAQAMLRSMGYELPEYGTDGKWSVGGETCNALLNFQKSCKDTFDGVNKNGTPESKKQVEHFQGIEPTGKLDQRTYKALEKSINNKVASGRGSVNSNQENTKAEKVKKSEGNPVNGKDYVFGNPELWLTNKSLILNLYKLQAQVKASKGTDFWKLDTGQQNILYSGLRMSGTTPPDMFINRLQAIRTIYNVPEEKGITFIDEGTVRGVIIEELKHQAAETWKKRIPIYLNTIKEQIQTSDNSYIDFVNLSQHEQKAIQYGLKVSQSGYLDADTARAFDALKVKNKIPDIKNHLYAVDLSTMNVIIDNCKKRTDWGNENKVLSSISDFMEDYNIGETFYGIVVLWAYPKIGRLAKVGEEALVSESAEQAAKGTGNSAKIPRTGAEWNEYYKSVYGSKNVIWKTEINSYDDIVMNPKALWGRSADEVEKMLGDGWTQGAYGSKGTGWKFTNGDRMVFYHPADGIHEGSYYGVTNGEIGRVKVVDNNYKPLSGDKAVIIPIGK